MEKYIITRKETDEIVAFAKQLGTLENGYWHSVLADIAYPDNTHYAYDNSGLVEDPKKIGEPIEIPAEIKPGKYCYTVEDGFYENSEYEEPVVPEVES